MSSNLRRFYCCLPLSQKASIESKGINYKGMFKGSSSLKLYHSKDAAERYLKTQLSGLLVIIDGSKLNPKFFSKVDYNSLFYYGVVPTNAFSIHKTKSGRILKSGRRPHIRKKGR